MKSGFLVAVAILPLLASCNKKADPQPDPPKVSEIAKVQGQSVLAEFVGDPQFKWLTTLSRLYPEEHQGVEAAMREQIATGATLIDAKRAMMDAVKPIMLRHKEALATTSDDQLIEYLRINTLVAERLLNEDTKACTDVFHGNLAPEVERPDAIWKLMSDATAQLLIAAHEAERNPLPARDTHLSPEDFQLWRVQMEGAGATPDTFALLSDPVRKASATDDEKCRVRVVMMRGALALPKTLAAKIALNVVATGPK